MNARSSHLIVAPAALLLLFCLVGCDSGEEAAPPPTPPAVERHPITKAEGDIATIIASTDSFKTLQKALERAELVEMLKGSGPFTLFAPSDRAFRSLPVGALDALMKDKDGLKEVLLYHVVKARMPSESITDRKTLKTMSAVPLSIDGSSRIMKVGDYAEVVQYDVVATNGIIHVIDQVLWPSSSTGREGKPAPDAGKGSSGARMKAPAGSGVKSE